MLRKLSFGLIVVVLLLPSHALAQQAGSTVSGTVTYRETIALPPSAHVTVELRDVSQADVAATTIVTQTIDPAGKAPPYRFELAYDPARIDQAHTYTVRATINDGAKLLFTSTQSYPVITRGAPTSGVEIVVQPVGGVATPEPPKTMPATGGSGGPLILSAAAGLAIIAGAWLVRRRRLG